MSPLRAFRLAAEKTADEVFSLVLSVQGIGRAMADHAGLLALIPDGVLLLLLDGPDGAVGVMTLDAATLAALIEMQTVGQVLPRPVRDRVLTRTDAAMAAPLVDGILRRMSQHLADHPDRHWACGYRFGAMIEDRRSLGLALGAPDYHVLRVPLDIAQGVRSGEVILALPWRADPALQTRDADRVEASKHLQARVLDAPVRLDAVLCRVSLPLSEIGRLAVGDLLPVPMDALRDIGIEAVGRRRVATARLGKIDGLRALRLTLPGQVPQGQGQISAGQGSAAEVPAAPVQGRSPVAAETIAPIQPTVAIQTRTGSSDVDSDDMGTVWSDPDGANAFDDAFGESVLDGFQRSARDSGPAAA